MGRIPEMEVLLAGGTKKPAGELKVGDKVETLHQHTLEKGEHEITYVRVIESPLLSLNLSGKEFTCAEEDRFYSTNRKGWLNATDLVKGDKISRLEGEVEFQGSTKLGKGQSVELTVDEAHTYVCSDLLLHNKGGGGGSPPPPPPPPKKYTESEYQANLKKEKASWQKAADIAYDKRLAGQRELWGAQEAARKSAFALEQRDLYDKRLQTRRGEWHTAAEKKYDRRLGEARTGWHAEAERRYDTRLGTAKTGWEQEEAKRAAVTQEAFDKKYGLLQGRYKQQGVAYDKRLAEEQSKFRHENQSRLDLLGRHEQLQGRFDVQGQNYASLQGRYQKRGKEYAGLQDKYATRGREYDTLQGKYQKRGQEYAGLQDKFQARGREYDSLQGRYQQRGKDYSGLQGKYRTKSGDYDTLSGKYSDLESRYQARGRDYRRNRPAPAQASTARTGLSSEGERKALLTGDYGYLETDKERARNRGSGSSYLDAYQKRFG